MKATKELEEQIAAAESLGDSSRERFAVRLCEALQKSINHDASMTKGQAELLGDAIGTVGYEFMPGSNVRYQDGSGICPLLVMQMATYINSCRE